MNTTKFRIVFIIAVILAVATPVYAGYVFPRMSTWTSGGIDYRLVFNPKEYTITANGGGIHLVAVGNDAEIKNFLIILKRPGQMYFYHYNNGQMLQNDFIGPLSSEVSSIVNALFDGLFTFNGPPRIFNIRNNIAVILSSNPFPFTINAVSAWVNSTR